MIGTPDAESIGAWLVRVRDCENALVEHAAERVADDEAARAPSLLPGWSRGHVLSHLARHADALSRMLEQAAAGVLVEQYPGGPEQRSAEIEAGAGRSAGALIADLRSSAERLVSAMEATPPAEWNRPLRFRAGEKPAHQALVSRWREAQIHRVDLRIGYTPQDWPVDFVEFLLPRELERLPDRAPGVTVPARLTESECLAWLLGRSTDTGLPGLPAWP
ncbi:maleylpyruvate isomerase family mycothiol-dependent enzyme [Streptomonospora sp. PA3]|uniref:maleylpyruvate isomerase family mycothiol-dependent enzyme n=1 Tax=Streptomonospora sp. PA3 TaxID=2607326 RepID=UPI0012DF9D2C|nr:maleylpyruvate isomerase family mycothiol-dependent enzyme [Streptomonospora sp. PA3]MUL43193.1 maleylpyruvate isomerase family mycothiol-dependent enzyme [Streptomonospora sp. PA3]